MPENTSVITKRIVLYNHKGGVGKTIITANLAYMLAQKGKKVLIVDSDPQTNISAYFLEENVLDNYLDNSDNDSGRTIWSAVRPIVQAEGDINIIEPLETNQENLFIIPGDIRLSEFEIKLTDYWRECFERKITGYRGTNALSNLITNISSSGNFHYVLYDVGPNIGPLNRSVLLDCDYFIIPAASDLFSKRALKTLGVTLSRWISDWQVILSLAPQNIDMMLGFPRYLGYLPQGYKIYRGVISSPASSYVSQIERDISEHVLTLLREINENLAPSTSTGSRIGEIKDFTQIVALGQQEGVPIWEVTKGTPSQKTMAKEAFGILANNIIEKTSQA
ncbi:MAG: AAA family ATPase [Ignavibacteria bacterium]|nr:AAA family ATPase [Ignavibacteria bacterium]